MLRNSEWVVNEKKAVLIKKTNHNYSIMPSKYFAFHTAMNWMMTLSRLEDSRWVEAGKKAGDGLKSFSLRVNIFSWTTKKPHWALCLEKLPSKRFLLNIRILSSSASRLSSVNFCLLARWMYQTLDLGFATKCKPDLFMRRDSWRYNSNNVTH